MKVMVDKHMWMNTKLQPETKLTREEMLEVC